MASTNKTSRGLSQFEGNDRLKRDDYNNDMKKIDDGLNGLDQSKEPKFTKKGGFNKEKTDSVTTDSSVILATAKAIKTVWDALTSHRNSTSNPHTVTKNQVGLGNVPNYTITDSTTDGSSLKFGSAKAIKTVWTKALEILGLTNTNKNAILNNTEQIEILFETEGFTLSLNSTYISGANIIRRGHVVIITFQTIPDITMPNDTTFITIVGEELYDQKFVMSDYSGTTTGNSSRGILIGNRVRIPSNPYNTRGSSYGQIVTLIK